MLTGKISAFRPLNVAPFLSPGPCPWRYRGDGIPNVHHINQKMAVHLQLNWMDRDYDQIAIILYFIFKFSI
jgi:hypothetical protein